MTWQIGVDIGGTFTDFVFYHPETGRLETMKLLSTPHDPAEAVLTGLAQGPQTTGAWRMIHGSTVATNALLERKGARTALVTTHGFGDVLQIGRQNRPSLYDFFANPAPALVPAERRFEVFERVDRSGAVLQALDAAQVAALVPELQAAEVETVAVCLLFSFLHPEHEKQIASQLRQAGFFVSASCEVLPEFREYERASTTTVNAYVTPALDRYLGHLQAALPGADLRIMQSNGGSLSVAQARRFGVRCVLSGPAGGVVGAGQVAHQAALGASLRSITFDMGGTSTDVALIHDAPLLTNEGSVGGCPVRIPLLDIHTIGAGGGSIARVDEGGALRVGPESAGAEPGPACYGRSEQLLPTVTDANLLLGRLPADYFLGGALPLHPQRARAALDPLAQRLGLSVEEAAAGVIEIANTHMARALRVISVERGYDPAEYCLVSFGGAGGLHAAALARELAIPQVLVSPYASVLSALGMLLADVIKDYSQTVMLAGEVAPDMLEATLAPLLARGQAELLAENIPAADIQLQPLLDVRYRGQSYELNIPYTRDWRSVFAAAHRHRYGYDRPETALEVVNVRLRALGKVQSPALRPRPLAGPDPSAALLAQRPVWLAGKVQQVAHYLGESLQPGNRLPGPALVLRRDTTILVGEGDMAQVDGYGNLLIQIGQS